jgi:hypothetical protein
MLFVFCIYLSNKKLMCVCVLFCRIACELVFYYYDYNEKYNFMHFFNLTLFFILFLRFFFLKTQGNRNILNKILLFNCNIKCLIK